jgi:hypothetical protein
MPGEPNAATPVPSTGIVAACSEPHVPKRAVGEPAKGGYFPIHSPPIRMARMPTGSEDELPDLLKAVRTRPLFVMRLQVRKLLPVGATPAGYRRVGVIAGGSFAGERLSGEVLDGGSDWQTVRPDGATILDVRLVLRTEDDALIGMTYRGIRHGPPEIMARIEHGEAVDPASYHFRISPVFETAASPYDWLNRVTSIGIGHRLADGPVYSVFEVL